MSTPSVVGMQNLKRMARYPVARRRLVQCFRWQGSVANICVYHDSDHAGCIRTRRSTSCAVIFHGDHVIKFLVGTQIPIGLSTGESEYYAAVRGGSAAIGAGNMAKDFGQHLRLELHGDATASKGIAQRTGVGKVRHLHRDSLWLQQKVRDRELTLVKTPGTTNPADLGTKYLAQKEIDASLRRMSFEFRAGRSAKSLAATTTA